MKRCANVCALQFSKNGQLWVCVDHVGSPEIMMSQGHLEEALKIDGTVLDSFRYISKLMAEKYLFAGYGVALPVAKHDDPLIRGVAKHLGEMAPILREETDHALRKHWGADETSGEWREMKIMVACADVVGQITNRMLVGLPLCRDDEFLKRAKVWSRLALQTAWVINMLPSFLERTLGLVLAYPSILLHHRALKMIVPFAAERIQNRQRRAADPDFAWEEPLDYMKFLLDEGGFDHVMDNDATSLARGALMVNTAAFHATGLTLGNLLLDVYSAPPGVVEALRAEALAVQAEYGLGSKQGLSRMVRIDSAIRESMRLRVMGLKAMHRFVRPAEGYTFSNGDHVPCGAHLSLPVLGRHLDAALYEDPNVFDAFRFSRDREDGTAAGVPDKKTRVRAAVNASPDHLPWGIGKSQCPGRFFAVDELKMVLAHILIYYEVQHIPQRPPNIMISSQSIPPLTASIKVRPRLGVAGPGS